MNTKDITSNKFAYWRSLTETGLRRGWIIPPQTGVSVQEYLRAIKLRINAELSPPEQGDPVKQIDDEFTELQGTLRLKKKNYLDRHAAILAPASPAAPPTPSAP